MQPPAKKPSSSSSDMKNQSDTPPSALPSARHSPHLCTFCRERTACVLCLSCQRRLSTLFSLTRHTGSVRTTSRIRAGKLQVVISTTIPTSLGLNSYHLSQAIHSALRKARRTSTPSVMLRGLRNSSSTLLRLGGKYLELPSFGITQELFERPGPSTDRSGNGK